MMAATKTAPTRDAAPNTALARPAPAVAVVEVALAALPEAVPEGALVVDLVETAVGGYVGEETPDGQCQWSL